MAAAAAAVKKLAGTSYGRVALRKSGSQPLLSEAQILKFFGSDDVHTRDRALVALLEFNEGALVSMNSALVGELVQRIFDTAAAPLLYRVHLQQVFAKMRSLPPEQLEYLASALEHHDARVQHNAQTALAILTSDDMIDSLLARGALWVAAHFARRPKKLDVSLGVGYTAAPQVSQSDRMSGVMHAQMVQRRTIGSRNDYDELQGPVGSATSGTDGGMGALRPLSMLSKAASSMASHTSLLLSPRGDPSVISSQKVVSSKEPHSPALQVPTAALARARALPRRASPPRLGTHPIHTPHPPLQSSGSAAWAGDANSPERILLDAHRKSRGSVMEPMLADMAAIIIDAGESTPRPPAGTPPPPEDAETRRISSEFSSNPVTQRAMELLARAEAAQQQPASSGAGATPKPPKLAGANSRVSFAEVGAAGDDEGPRTPQEIMCDAARKRRVPSQLERSSAGRNAPGSTPRAHPFVPRSQPRLRLRAHARRDGKDFVRRRGRRLASRRFIRSPGGDREPAPAREQPDVQGGRRAADAARLHGG